MKALFYEIHKNFRKYLPQHWINCIHFIFCQYFSILGEKIDQAEFIAYQDSFNAFDSNNNGRISHKSLQVNIVNLKFS